MMDIEKMLSISLRAGVLLCVVLICIGIALVFVDGGGGGFGIAQLASLNSPANSLNIGVAQIINGLENFDGLSFIVLGLMVLIATPIVRVFLSIIYFAATRNRLYTAITIIVMINLVIAILIVPGLLGH